MVAVEEPKVPLGTFLRKVIILQGKAKGLPQYSIPKEQFLSVTLAAMYDLLEFHEETQVDFPSFKVSRSPIWALFAP